MFGRHHRRTNVILQELQTCALQSFYFSLEREADLPWTHIWDGKLVLVHAVLLELPGDQVLRGNVLLLLRGVARNFDQLHPASGDPADRMTWVYSKKVNVKSYTCRLGKLPSNQSCRELI